MAAERPDIDDLAATISDQLRVLISEVQPGCLSRALHLTQGEHGFPEVTNIVKSSPDLHGALEALPSLPGSGMPAIYLKKCEPFDLGIELLRSLDQLGRGRVALQSPDALRSLEDPVEDGEVPDDGAIREAPRGA
jgi:hypothetical protein